MANEEPHKLVDVCACGSDGEASIVIGLLQDHGIAAHRDSDLPHSVYPVANDATVYVHENDADRARAILAERTASAQTDATEAESEASDGEDH